jgi:hypothetical protein
MMWDLLHSFFSTYLSIPCVSWFPLLEQAPLYVQHICTMCVVPLQVCKQAHRAEFAAGCVVHGHWQAACGTSLASVWCVYGITGTHSHMQTIQVCSCVMYLGINK